MNPILLRSNRDAAAAPPHQPHAPDQILVSLTHRVVMNFQVPRERPHAGQRLSGFQLARGNVKNDLLRQLLAKGDFAFSADANVHLGL